MLGKYLAEKRQRRWWLLYICLAAHKRDLYTSDEPLPHRRDFGGRRAEVASKYSWKKDTRILSKHAFSEQIFGCVAMFVLSVNGPLVRGTIYAHLYISIS